MKVSASELPPPMHKFSNWTSSDPRMAGDASSASMATGERGTAANRKRTSKMDFGDHRRRNPKTRKCVVPLIQAAVDALSALRRRRVELGVSDHLGAAHLSHDRAIRAAAGPPAEGAPSSARPPEGADAVTYLPVRANAYQITRQAGGVV
jgi:hypothetical protein